MKWRQKYHVTSAVPNVPLFAFISQWRVAARHNRAGIVPTLVASERRRPGTGPPRQVHRIRALVWVYCTTIQIYKYKIIQKYSYEDEAVTAHLARQPATNPPGHTLEPPKSVYLGESKVRPSHCRELSCNPDSHDGNLKRPKRRRAGHRECPPSLDIRNVHLIVIDCGDKYSSWQWSTQLDTGWGNVIWCRTRILGYCELEFFPTNGAGLC